MATKSHEDLQCFILEGRKILIRKETKQPIQIRFNNYDIDGTRKWRLIIDGVEFYTSEINILTHSRTESAFFENLGEYKHHIVVDSQRVEFNNNEAIIY